MKIINDYNNCPADARGAVVAIGNFDGIHLGHQQIIKETIKIAKEGNLKSGLITFEPHPIDVLREGAKIFRLTPSSQKAKIIKDIGIDILYELNFNKDLSKLPATDFFQKILLDKLNIKHIIVGYNFIFGYKRSGNVELLKKLCKENNIGFSDIFAIKNNQDLVYSSSLIRDNLSKANLNEVKNLLGRNFSITGKIVKGIQKASQLGYPTANIEIDEFILLPFGVYAVNIIYNKKIYKGIANIGIKPTITNISKPLLEVHIFDFNQDIYDKEIEVELLEYIRAEKKFKNIDELKSQIKQDVNIVLRAL